MVAGDIDPTALTDSLNSSPRSLGRDRASMDSESERDRDREREKVRLMCSFGGRILPRPHDNQLCYVGGDTRIVRFHRNISFSALMQLLCKLCNVKERVALKYQLPTEDLDSLISVTSDEDLDNMLDEYDRLRLQAKNSNSNGYRLRLFLFQSLPQRCASLGAYIECEKREHWFLDALNGGTALLSSTSSIASEIIPDFLFGLDTDSATALESSASPPAPEKDCDEHSDVAKHAAEDDLSELHQLRKVDRLPSLKDLRRVDSANSLASSADDARNPLPRYSEAPTAASQRPEEPVSPEPFSAATPYQHAAVPAELYAGDSHCYTPSQYVQSSAYWHTDPYYVAHGVCVLPPPQHIAQRTGSSAVAVPHVYGADVSRAGTGVLAARYVPRPLVYRAVAPPAPSVLRPLQTMPFGYPQKGAGGAVFEGMGVDGGSPHAYYGASANPSVNPAPLAPLGGFLSGHYAVAAPADNNPEALPG